MQAHRWWAGLAPVVECVSLKCDSAPRHEARAFRWPHSREVVRREPPTTATRVATAERTRKLSPSVRIMAMSMRTSTTTRVSTTTLTSTTTRIPTTRTSTTTHIYDDAHRPAPDACVPQQVQLLVNAGFDLGPNNGWHEVQVGGELLSTHRRCRHVQRVDGRLRVQLIDQRRSTVSGRLRSCEYHGAHAHRVLRRRHDGRSERLPYDTGTVELARASGTVIETALGRYPG